MRAFGAGVGFFLFAIAACGGGDDASSEALDASSADGASFGDANPIVDAGADVATANGPRIAYASGYGPDLAVFSVDSASGVLTAKSSVDAGDPSPSFLAVRPGLKNLYAVSEASPGRVGAYAMDADGALSYLGSVSSTGNGPLNETASSISSLTFSSTTGLLAEIETQTTLPTPYTGGANTGAEVWVHPSGRFVYASNRGDDSIAIFSVDLTTGKLTRTVHPKTGGTTPRMFTIDPSGTHLYAANQGSSTITSFAIDVADGSLTSIGSPISQMGASFVGVVQLP